MKYIKIFAVLLCLFFSVQAMSAAPGDLDATFGNGGKVMTQFGELTYRGRAVLVQNDGKIVVAGHTYNNSTYDFAVARYNADGSLDASFGSGGAVVTPIGISSDYVTGAALQADGKIVVVGTVWTGLEQFGVVRYNADGSLDTTFNGTGKITTDMIDNVGYDSPYAARVQTDGRILVGGTCSNKICLARYNTNGSLDNSFDGDGKLIIETVNVHEQEAAEALAVQNDGKILAAGNIRLTNGNNDFLIVRINQNGTLDTSFGSAGRVITPVSLSTDFASAIAVASDGKIVAAGKSYRIGSPLTRPDVFTDYDAAIVRYLPDGSLDASFDGDGKAAARFGEDRNLFDDFINAVSIQQNGKVLISGYSWDGSRYNFTLARFNTNGSLDAGFGNNGKVLTTIGTLEDKGYAMALQKDGKIIVVGESHFGDRLSLTVVRYLGDAVETVRKNQFDYDSDGRADVSVFRPESGVWHLLQSQSGYAAPQFGVATDKLVPADYDGDGKTDLAVFRENPSDPGKAKFFIFQSSNNQLKEEQLGSTGDIPVSGDWDGDGKTDVGVYRSGIQTNQQGYFYYRPSSQPNVNFIPYAWGIAGDKPVIADYDGDGKTDPAVFRPSTGGWFVQRSRDGFYAIQFGAAEDKPVAADYDGDGKADQAVFRPSNGVWYLWNSRDGFSAAQFGISTDKPVPADYDGDGKTDIAIYRDGGWFILNNTSGFAALGFGTATDKPVPNSFVP
jgi:uncharacterized delta-60 repeat protein